MAGMATCLRSFPFLLLLSVVQFPLAAAIPAARYGHTAVWTGTEMIIWGGANNDGTARADGGRYNPRTGAWTSISTVNAPTARFDHTAISTGTDMAIWGGRTGGFNFLAEGWFYNPALDLWSPMNGGGQPAPRNGHAAVWTGSEMIIWGGANGNLLNSGGFHRLPAETWSVVTTNGAPGPRSTFSTVWTGSRMIIWGGATTIVQGPFADGGRYDPVADHWTPVSLVNGPAARYGNAAAWTGSEMFIWSGYDGASFLTDGRRYNAASDTWLNLPTSGAPSPRAYATTIFTGNEVIVWGGGTAANTNTGGRYNVASGTWSATSTNGAPAARAQHTAVWSGSEMIVWGGRNFSAFDDVARYNPLIDSWTTFAPGVVTLNAISDSPQSMIFSGLAYPNNTNTTVWFDWGVSTNFGNRTTAQSIGGGTNVTNFAHLVNGLVGGVTYHFRAVASNSLGLARGSNQSVSVRAFYEIASGLPGVTYSSVGWGDYDNDGRLDILLSGSTGFTNKTSEIWRNTGAGFVNINAGLTNVLAGAAAWGDFNNDNFLDIFLAGSRSVSSGGEPSLQIGQFLRNTNGAFTFFTNGPSAFLEPAKWGDYNNDGLIDLLVGRGSLMRNTGAGFTNTDILPPVLRGAVAWGDYDNDGRLDFALMGRFSSGPLVSGVWRNTGNGFTNINAGLPGLSDGAMAWGDYDNDGRLDLLLAGSTLTFLRNPITQIWRNTGSGFTNINAGLPGVMLGSVAWGDLDNDGRIDLALTGATSANTVPTNFVSQLWRNTGSGFTKLEDLIPVAASSVALADYDNDGRLDILLTGATSFIASNGLPAAVVSQIWRNNLPAINTAPTAPTGLAATVTGDSVLLSWNSGSDAQTPSVALTYNVRVGTTPGGSDVLAPASTSSGWRRLPEMGNAQLGLGTRLKYDLGKPYYWSVQTVDGAFAGSAFSAAGSFKVLQPPPLIVLPTTTTFVPGDINGDETVDESDWNQWLATYWPNSSWLQMTNVAGLGGSNITFALSNSTTGAFGVEFTTNLVNWEFLGLVAPRYLFTDTNAPTQSQRFYRLRYP